MVEQRGMNQHLANHAGLIATFGMEVEFLMKARRYNASYVRFSPRQIGLSKSAWIARFSQHSVRPLAETATKNGTRQLLKLSESTG